MTDDEVFVHKNICKYCAVYVSQLQYLLEFYEDKQLFCVWCYFVFCSI